MNIMYNGKSLLGGGATDLSSIMTGYSKKTISDTNKFPSNTSLKVNKIHWFCGIINAESDELVFYYNGPVAIMGNSHIGITGMLGTDKTSFYLFYGNDTFDTIFGTGYAKLTGTLYYNGTPVYPK